MGYKNDVAIIEERITTDPLLKQYSLEAFDIRIMCFNLVPKCYAKAPNQDPAVVISPRAICTGIDVQQVLPPINAYEKNVFLSDTYEIIDSTLDLKENRP